MNPEPIRQILRDRGIQWLCHFTHRDNLDSIRQHGLLGRKQQERMQIQSAGSHESRRDRYRDDYVSCSLTWLNKPMFKMVTERSGWSRKEMVLLRIHAEVLTEPGCRFVPWNSASLQTAMSEEVDPLVFEGPAALQRMFDDTVHYALSGGRTRTVDRKHTMHRNVPTDIQAEVLVRSPIRPEQIASAEVVHAFERRDLGFPTRRLSGCFGGPPASQQGNVRKPAAEGGPDQRVDYDELPF